MDKTNALAIRREVTPATWQHISQIAPVVAASHLFAIARPESAAVIMLKGYELGLSLSGSFEFVQIVEGKPTLIPRGHLALLHASGLFVDPGYLRIEDRADENGNPVGCCVAMKRRDTGFEYSITFTLDDARRAGLVKDKSAWDKYPANMLRWRAIGFCADVVAPDVGGGMKRADELGADLSPDGDVIDGELVDSFESDLEQAVATYGGENILAANGGKIPVGANELTQAINRIEVQE